MVSAWASANRMVLGQRKVEDKSNEITAIPALLAVLDISGCVVTADALDTQTEIARAIVQQEAEYILPVKRNQSTLYEDIQDLFEGFEADNYVEVVYDTPNRSPKLTTDENFANVGWSISPNTGLSASCKRLAQLTSVLKLLTVRMVGDKTSVELPLLHK